MEHDPIDETAGLLALLGNRGRLRALLLLRARGEACVGELMEKAGTKQALTSINLGDLLKAGLVERRRQGVQAFYRLTHAGADALAAFDAVHSPRPHLTVFEAAHACADTV